MNDKQYLKRFKVMIIIISLFIVLVIGQYTSVMLFKTGERLTNPAGKAIVERGPILDRNGKVLAIQTRLYSVTAWTPNIIDIGMTTQILSTVLNLDSSSLQKKLSQKNRFLYIKRKISPSENKEIQKKIDQGLLPGITMEAEYGRNYPEKTLAAHVLGYVGTDNTGLNGIEYTYNSDLSPSASPGETVYGNQVFLTIDLNIQYFAEEVAMEAYEKNKADGVMLLIMDAKSGDILGYVSLPTFDPNTYNLYSSEKWENRPISFAYEPGSVFKIFSLSSMLDSGSVSPTDTFFCNGYYVIDVPGEEQINCLGEHGVVDPQEIIQYSCNAGAAYASEKISAESFYNYLQLYGFGSPTGLPFTGESHGILREPEDWSIRSKPTIAMGQEISVSAVQIVTAATAIANKGILLKPNIVKKILSPEGQVLKYFESEPVRRVLSEDTAKGMLSMMETTTNSQGTAWRAKVDGIRMSAKTGTAQMLDPKTGKYSEDAYIASCLSIFPTDDPQVIVYIVIVNPKGPEHYGGRIAAPEIKKIAQDLVPYLGIPGEKDTVLFHSGQIILKNRQLPKFINVVPDYTGFSKKEILPLLKKKDLNVTITGEGWVVKQAPSPGTPFKPGMTLSLEFE